MTDYATRRAVAKPAADVRILLDGVDITSLNGSEVPPPDYLLTEPFAYGPTTLSIPGVDASLDELGVGILSPVRVDAMLEIQRVDDRTLGPGATVLATDYRGFVVTINRDGRDLSLEIGGELSGPASNIVKHNPLIRRVKDVGFWFANALEILHMQPASRSGPVTGISLVEGGGGSLADWMSEVCAWSQTTSGAQRTIMPTVWGGNVWDFGFKDTATKHLTLFTEDAGVVANLRRDRTEIPTTWYGTGVSPDGVRWRNARYPGVFTDQPPDFPGTMSSGDSGDGVEVLNRKLVAMGLLSVEGLDYAFYGASTVAAVKELQDRAGLSQTGTTNEATFNALWNKDITGYSLSDAHVAPLLQDPRVRMFNESADGSIISRNDEYDATVKDTQRFTDFGPNTTKAQATTWCRGQYARLAGKNWSGTIELNGFGAFVGEWNPGDEPTADDVMSQLDIRPGMNAWLPLFDDGTLVHISGVQVNRSARQVVLTVDTLARDLLELNALNQRDTEARRSIRREWRASNRPTKQSGNMVVRDEYFGILDRNLTLNGGRWNVFPVIVGQSGQVNKTRLRTTDDEAEFAVLATRIKVTEKRLDRRVGDPLVVSDESWLEKASLEDWFEDKVILYAAGDGKQPCGYAPRRHRDDAGEVTDAPITGRHRDDSPWPYECTASQPAVIYMAVYPDRDCTLKKGQILWPQLDDAI